MQLNNTPIYIGTSGYNHDDWKGNFAPADIDNYDLLTYYSNSGMNFLELAFTFYRIPEKDKIHHILLRTESRVSFSIRLPKLLIKNPNDDKTYNDFMQGISPIIDSGLLKCVYADFHPTFSVSKKNLDMILALKEKFEVPFFAELINRTWYKGRVFDFFKKNNIGMTVIDMPQIKGFAPYYPLCLNNNIYLKLYGKSPLWLTANSKDLNYSYSSSEISKILDDTVDKSVTAQSIFMVFANVANGNAPTNALRTIEEIKVFDE